MAGPNAPSLYYHPPSTNDNPAHTASHHAPPYTSNAHHILKPAHPNLIMATLILTTAPLTATIHSLTTICPKHCLPLSKWPPAAHRLIFRARYSADTHHNSAHSTTSSRTTRPILRSTLMYPSLPPPAPSLLSAPSPLNNVTSVLFNVAPQWCS